MATPPMKIEEKKAEVKKTEVKPAPVPNELDLIRKAMKAPVTDFVVKEPPEWNPKLESAPKELRGIYIGRETQYKRTYHTVRTENPKAPGTLVDVKFTGSHALTRALKRIGPNNPVMVSFADGEWTARELKG